MSRNLQSWNSWKKLILFSLLLPILCIAVITGVVYFTQDSIVQSAVDDINKKHEGLLVIGDTHIAPFKNFPYISVKVDSVRVYESKEIGVEPILNVADIYIGFNIWDLVNGRYDIQKLLIEDGFFNIVLHEDGRLNIENALSAPDQDIEAGQAMDMHLKNIELHNLDIHQYDEVNEMDVETFIYWAESGFKTSGHLIDAHIDSEFELNIISGRDTSFVKHKHFELHTDVLFNELTGLLEIAPSGLKLENGDFEIRGSIETSDDNHLDLHINGSKSNFDMLIAFAPENLIPALESYNNAGTFYFNADIVGPTSNGRIPFVDVEFGASEAFLENVDARKKMDDLGFRGHFTTGSERTFETMEFSIEDFTSKLDRGNFNASLFVKNFIEPDVALDLDTDFDLSSVTQFFNISSINNVSGDVILNMKFHDIIDLEHPEKALNQLNQAYFSELTVKDLHLESPNLKVPIDRLNMHLAMNGKQGVLDQLDLKMGASDISVKGTLSDVPAIVHHTDIPVSAELEISSSYFDMAELTGFASGDTTGIDEQIKDLRLRLKATSSAREITESQYLPEGEFIIEELHAQFEHFAHELHDFYADLIIDGQHIEVIDLKGYVDQSDFSIKGALNNYGPMIFDTLSNDTASNQSVEAVLTVASDFLDIAALTDYSTIDSTGIDEQIKDFRIQLKFNSTPHGLTQFKYLPVGEFFIDDLHAQLKHYPHELHDFHADVLIDDRDMKVKDFTGYIDKSDFHLNGHIYDFYFWMKDTVEGDVRLDFNLNADLLKLEDIFSYQGENYVPEDYRHEEFDQLKLHLTGDMHYVDSDLQSVDILLDQFDAKMHVHPMRMEDFSGRLHYEDDHLVIEDMHGKIGRTVFDLDMNYYLGNDTSIKLRDNHIGLKADYIDFDQLFAFNTSPSSPAQNETVQDTTTEDVAVHSDAFNIYELPFTDMTIDLDVDHFIYHHIEIQNIHSRMRTTPDHYIYIDTLTMQAAGGGFYMSGYFNGSNPDQIYLKPNLKVEGADIDQLLFKYENFGQDIAMSDYIHGQVSADITGNIRVYPDMIPDIDQSEIHMDVEILNGRLENYEPVLMLSDYMGDKNLSLVRFDTLQNHMDVIDGTIRIPNMTIESTLGHYELSGEQSIGGQIDYYIRIPWKIIKQSAVYKLFGNKKESVDASAEEEIIEKDLKRKTRYLNLRVKGTLDDFDIQLRKKKDK